MWWGLEQTVETSPSWLRRRACHYRIRSLLICFMLATITEYPYIPPEVLCHTEYDSWSTVDGIYGVQCRQTAALLSSSFWWLLQRRAASSWPADLLLWRNQCRSRQHGWLPTIIVCSLLDILLVSKTEWSTCANWTEKCANSYDTCVNSYDTCVNSYDTCANSIDTCVNSFDTCANSFEKCANWIEKTCNSW